MSLELVGEDFAFRVLFQGKGLEIERGFWDWSVSFGSAGLANAWQLHSSSGARGRERREIGLELRSWRKAKVSSAQDFGLDLSIDELSVIGQRELQLFSRTPFETIESGPAKSRDCCYMQIGSEHFSPQTWRMASFLVPSATSFTQNFRVLLQLKKF